MKGIHPGVTAAVATLVTIAGGVLTVWLVDDVRAFGFAFVVAGTLASAVAFRSERVSTRPRKKAARRAATRPEARHLALPASR